MPSAAKQKGNSWEREVAKNLSEIFNENFLRVPNSGAYTGGANVFRVSDLTEAQRRMMDGDIIVPPCMSNFKIECKNYGEFCFHQLFDTNKTLDKWITQAESGILWFLLIKVTRKGSFVVFSKELQSVFSYENYLHYKDKYIITSYNNFWNINADTIRQLNKNPESVLQTT